MLSRIRLFILALLAVAAGVAAWFYFTYWQAPMVPRQLASPHFVYIPTGLSYEEALDTLKDQGVVANEPLFRMLAQRMAYARNPMRAGRYEVQPGWSGVQLIRHLRAGAQAPVKVVLTTEREWFNVAAKAARFLEADSLAFAQLLSDPVFLDSIGFTPQTLHSLFIPNSYEMYWNTTPRAFVARMLREHSAFWDANNRRAKAEALGMTPAEVYTLASIIEKETEQNSEKRRMAGVYLNRLRDGWPLQADPTAVFATRDFAVTRVLDYHTQFDSPYNTYRYGGLPPGPIAMASIASIDAVLNAENHEFMFFCAAGDGSGLHNFAETGAGHSRNIAIYVANLKRRGLR